jgi:TonB family protein
MIKAVVVALIACNLVAPVWADQPGPQSDIPSCSAAPLPDNMVRPKYPKDALRSGTAGQVELRAIVAPDGKLNDLALISGNPEFSQSSLAAIRKWRFRPVSDQGHPVETIYKIHVRFNPMLREANSDVELESPQIESRPRSSPQSVLQQSSGEQVHGISEPGIVGPKPLYQPEPELSEASRKNAEQGNVNIALVVGSNGLPRDLKVICSSIPASNQNALNAVKEWTFAPATKDGKPVAAAIVVEVEFHLYSGPVAP